MIIVSACLAGVNCKYNGGNNLDKRIVELFKKGEVILVCPEQLGGLSTPRNPSEIIKKHDRIKVINNKGEDVTDNFINGGEETLNIAKKVGAKIAILKAHSPSCGYGKIYDGTFSGKLTKGNGITAELLVQNGIKVYTEDNLTDKILKELEK